MYRENNRVGMEVTRPPFWEKSHINPDELKKLIPEQRLCNVYWGFVKSPYFHTAVLHFMFCFAQGPNIYKLHGNKNVSIMTCSLNGLLLP